MAARRANATKVSCKDCYFGCNLLCALALEEPCPTFRPNRPEGLCPPDQLRFQLDPDRRTRALWMFPSAQEQAAMRA